MKRTYYCKPSKTKLGKFLRSKRCGLGLSQKEMAARCGMFQPNYNLYETGHRIHPGIQAQKMFAAVCTCTDDEIRSLIDPRPLKIKKPHTKLGRFIVRRLKALQISLGGLARRLSIDHSSVWTLIYETKTVRQQNAARLSAVLKCSMSDLEPFIFVRYKQAKKKPGSKLGAMIRAERERKKMSQSDLAALLECAKQYVNAVEGGRQSVGRHAALRIAKCLAWKIPSKLLAAAPIMGRPKGRKNKVRLSA